MANNRKRRKSLNLNKDKHKKAAVIKQTDNKSIKSAHKFKESSDSSFQKIEGIEKVNTEESSLNENKENNETVLNDNKEKVTTAAADEKIEELSYIRRLAKTLTNQTLNTNETCLSIHIKSITFYNFKSYKGIHKIPMLDKRFNVVVGPNGSGKSNIIDGIQFLFGYTAKKMRHLTIGNLVNDSSVEGNAYVEMELEGEISSSIFECIPELVDVGDLKNKKITLKRTVNKSGKSVYSINNNTVSNKIMIGFLSKLGIDTRTNRFLILQGEIESIGLLKPKSEQSFKYSYKPEIMDIKMMEMEVSKIMKEEAEFNNSFGLLEYFEQVIGTLSFNYRIQRLKEISNCLNEKLEAEKPTYTYNKNEYEKYESKFKKQQETLKDYCLFINKLQTVKNFKTKLEEEIKKKNLEKIFQIQKETEKEKKIIEKENELIKKIVSEFNELKEKEVEIKQHIKRGNDFINKIDLTFKDIRNKEIEINKQEELNKKENTKDEEELHLFTIKFKEVEAKVKEENNTKNKMAENKKKEIKEELMKINNEMSTKINMEKDRTNLINSIREEEGVLEKEDLLSFKGSGLNYKDFKRKYKETFKKDIPETSKAFTDILNSLRDTQIEYQTLKSTINSNSILNLLNIKGVHGRVIDLIKVPKPFKKAFISSCRGLLNNIIVDSKEIAQECIQILKRNNKRCTFLVLNDFQQFEGKPIPVVFDSKDNHLLFLTNKYNQGSTSDCVYPLSSFVHCNLIYYPLFKSFLTTYLCPDYLLKHIAFNKNQRCVNLEGMVIERSGVMYKQLNSDCTTFTEECGIRNCHCGKEERTNQNNRSLEERRNLKEIEEEIHNKELELNCFKELEKYKENIKEKEMATKKVEELIKAICSIDFTLNSTNENTQIRLKEVIQNAHSLKNNLNKEISVLTKDMALLKEELSRCQSPYEKQIKLKYEIENKILKIKEKIKKGDSSLNALKRRQRNTLQFLNEEIKTFSKTNQIPLPLVLIEANLNDSCEEVKTGTDDFCEEIKPIINEYVKTLIHKETEISEKADILKTRIQNLKDNLTKLFNKQFERENEIENLKKSGLEVHSLKIDESCLQNIDRLKKYNSSFEMSEESLENENTEIPVKIRILEVKIEELRFVAEKYNLTKGTKKVISMSPPDFNFLELAAAQMKIFKRSVDEFEKLEATQRDLIFLIETLKITRRKLFETEFERIKQKFKFIYRTLTFGGNAEIELVNFLDPFDGLQLSVMPLKKSWTSVRNLSGGEKTLTSLSLLFAIQYSKPSPFYFLDEIDAALDYRNVNVIANFLLMEKAQFIIISLRNDMVEKAKELIGVCKNKTESQIICLKI